MSCDSQLGGPACAPCCSHPEFQAAGCSSQGAGNAQVHDRGTVGRTLNEKGNAAMVKLLQDGEDGHGSALFQRLEKVQFKMLKPLLWKSLTQEPFMAALSEMGLCSFFKSKFVAGDEALCKEFLCSYRKHGSAVVRQQVVQTDPQLVQTVLRLPHSGKLVKEAPKLTAHDLHDLYNGPSVKVKHNGYSVKALCDPYFKEFVSFLVDRMSCKVNCTYVSAEILYAAKYVWETKSVLDWASYMSHRIQAQCEKVRGTSQSAFEYTQYLTQMIHYQLGIQAQGEQVQPLLVNGFSSSSSAHLHHSDLDAPVLLADKRPKRQAETRNGKKQRLVAHQEGPEHALSLLSKVSGWIKSQAAEENQKLSLAEDKILELESELEKFRKRCHIWEAQYNHVQQEKVVLQEQLQGLVVQQQSLRERLEQSERDKEQLKMQQAYIAMASKDARPEQECSIHKQR